MEKVIDLAFSFSYQIYYKFSKFGEIQKKDKESLLNLSIYSPFMNKAVFCRNNFEIFSHSHRFSQSFDIFRKL